MKQLTRMNVPSAFLIVKLHRKECKLKKKNYILLDVGKSQLSLDKLQYLENSN